jgi:6-phosphofructokinase 1
MLGDFMPLTLNEVSGILPRGGTILGTTNRDNPFKYPDTDKCGYSDRSDDVLRNFCEIGLDALIAIGGDGSLHIAMELARKGLRVVGVPKTIDNDLKTTDMTFGFMSAVETAQEALDKLHTTAESHHRVMILEVMGRYAGWIALYAGLAGGADVILIPEIPYDMAKVAEAVSARRSAGRTFSIIVVAEGAFACGGERVMLPGTERLGGVGANIALELEACVESECRVTVLGHIQRGGSPNTYDRLLATQYGVAALEAVRDGESEGMVALRGQDIVRVPLAEAVSRLRLVEEDNAVLRTARHMSVKFGD